LHNNASLTAAINEGLYLSTSAVQLMASFGASTGSGDDDDEGGKQKTPEETYSEIAADSVARCP
jgi:hypothetical protein